VANTDDDNLSELLDDDKLDGMQFPPDQPLGVNDRGIDESEDSVEERRRRELPDRQGHDDRGEIGTLVDQAEDGIVDDEADAVATEARYDRDQLGRDVSVQDLEEVQPAEEAAMHLTEDPPYDADDGYVED
jgi:hypothetical protein